MGRPQIDFSGVVLCHNRWEMTERTVRSLQETLADNEHAEVIVVDNGSTDETREKLPGLLGGRVSNVVLNSENLGASQGYNTGLRLAKGHFLGIIDNDHEFREGWYEEVMRVFGVFPEVGVVSPSDTRVENRLTETEREGVKVLIDPVNVPGCAFFRGPLLKSTAGRFAVQGHLYGDTDLLLCRRAHLYGFTCVYTFEPYATHLDKDIRSEARDKNEAEQDRIRRGLKHDRLFFDFYY